MSEELAEAVRKAIERSSASVRALAIAAGVDQSALARIVSGERGASPALARKVMEALATWAEDCTQAERLLGEALEREGHDG